MGLEIGRVARTAGLQPTAVEAAEDGSGTLVEVIAVALALGVEDPLAGTIGLPRYASIDELLAANEAIERNGRRS